MLIPSHPLPPARTHRLLAGFLSLALHAVVVAALVGGMTPRFHVAENKPEPKESIAFLEVVSAPPEPVTPQPPASAASSPPVPVADLAIEISEDDVAASVQAVQPTRPQVSMEAPPPPTAEEWAFAARYTNKNSKAYRYSWGQQVRSMMGTAVEGLDQGIVRFRVEIGPAGKLVKLDTLWTTSKVAEQLARRAIESMPPLPPTPNGRPLVFEKTISFTPYASDGLPLYKNDCEPDPPQHGNRFAWDGRSPQRIADEPVAEKLDPAAYAECLKQLPQDSIEAEAASDERQQKQWTSPTLGR